MTCTPGRDQGACRISWKWSATKAPGSLLLEALHHARPHPDNEDHECDPGDRDLSDGFHNHRARSVPNERDHSYHRLERLTRCSPWGRSRMARSSCRVRSDNRDAPSDPRRPCQIGGPFLIEIRHGLVEVARRAAVASLQAQEKSVTADDLLAEPPKRFSGSIGISLGDPEKGVCCVHETQPRGIFASAQEAFKPLCLPPAVRAKLPP